MLIKIEKISYLNNSEQLNLKANKWLSKTQKQSSKFYLSLRRQRLKRKKCLMKYEDFKEKKRNKKNNESFLKATWVMLMFKRNLMINWKNNKTKYDFWKIKLVKNEINLMECKNKKFLMWNEIQTMKKSCEC